MNAQLSRTDGSTAHRALGTSLRRAAAGEHRGTPDIESKKKRYWENNYWDTAPAHSPTLPVLSQGWVLCTQSPDSRLFAPLAGTSGESMAQIGRNLGITVSRPRKWRRRLETDGKNTLPGHGRLPSAWERRRL